MTEYLLDTHALIWWMSSNPRLPAKAVRAIESDDSRIYASAVNAFEIGLKHGLGKLDVADALVRNYESDLAEAGFLELPITARHALAAGALDMAHRDPFDRILIAQARTERLILISNEALFDRCGIVRLWD